MWDRVLGWKSGAISELVENTEARWSRSINPATHLVQHTLTHALAPQSRQVNGNTICYLEDIWQRVKFPFMGKALFF